MYWGIPHERPCTHCSNMFDVCCSTVADHMMCWCLQAEQIPYCDDIAGCMGCTPPPLWKMLWSDLKLAAAVWLGPFLPIQYRLSGPGARKDARDMLMHAIKVYSRIPTVMQRT